MNDDNMKDILKVILSVIAGMMVGLFPVWFWLAAMYLANGG